MPEHDSVLKIKTSLTVDVFGRRRGNLLRWTCGYMILVIFLRCSEGVVSSLSSHHFKKNLRPSLILGFRLSLPFRNNPISFSWWLLLVSKTCIRIKYYRRNFQTKSPYSRVPVVKKPIKHKKTSPYPPKSSIHERRGQSRTARTSSQSQLIQ